MRRWMPRCCFFCKSLHPKTRCRRIKTQLPDVENVSSAQYVAICGTSAHQPRGSIRKIERQDRNESTPCCRLGGGYIETTYVVAQNKKRRSVTSGADYHHPRSCHGCCEASTPFKSSHRAVSRLCGRTQVLPGSGVGRYPGSLDLVARAFVHRCPKAAFCRTRASA